LSAVRPRDRAAWIAGVRHEPDHIGTLKWSCWCFEVDDVAGSPAWQAGQFVAGDPLVQEDLLERRWVKEWAID